MLLTMDEKDPFPMDFVVADWFKDLIECEYYVTANQAALVAIRSGTIIRNDDQLTEPEGVICIIKLKDGKTLTGSFSDGVHGSIANLRDRARENAIVTHMAVHTPGWQKEAYHYVDD